jgi:hypothetical protein
MDAIKGEGQSWFTSILSAAARPVPAPLQENEERVIAMGDFSYDVASGPTSHANTAQISRQ